MTPDELLERNVHLEVEMKELKRSLSKANSELIKYRVQKKELKQPEIMLLPF